MAPQSTFKGVIFDLFGTLVEDFTTGVSPTDRDLPSILNAPREPFQQLWRRTANMRIDGTFQTVEASIAHVCDAIGVKPTEEQTAEAAEFRLQQIRRALTPKPDAAATLAQLKATEYKLGLLSNCSIEIPILWPETPLAAFFKATIFSSRARLTKPDPQIFRLACDHLAVAPVDCVYVADGENRELAAAAKIGMHSVLIRNPAAEKRPELFKEVREWQGWAITALSEVLTLVGVGSDNTTSGI
jgi:putative hydrolase of the HAD superfamily